MLRAAHALGIALLTTVSSACGNEAASLETVDASTDAAAEVDAAAPPRELTCVRPTMIVQPGTDVASGLVRCESGLIERVRSEPIVREDFGAQPCDDGGFGRACTQHADCNELEVCTFSYDGDETCGCNPTCRSDQDCGEGKACLALPVGDYHFATTEARCVPASCRTSADCGSGRCVLSLVPEVCDVEIALACMDDRSECYVDSDCPRAEYGCGMGGALEGFCRLDQRSTSTASTWHCAPSHVACDGADCE